MSKIKAYVTIFFMVIFIYLIIQLFFKDQNVLNNWLNILLNVSATCIIVLFYEMLTSLAYWEYFFQSRILYRKFDIRVSCSYLFRIKIEGKYLLIKGRRIDQYQPVGGVYKKLPDCQKMFQSLGIKDDNNIQIDDESEEDLRIRVPAKSFLRFLKWYDSKKDREVTQWREFCEELVQTKILTVDNFPHIRYRFLKTIKTGIKFSEYYKIHELLIYDIFELIPNNKQTEELKNLMKNDNEKRVIWAEDETIERLGYIGIDKKYQIGEHSKLII